MPYVTSVERIAEARGVALGKAKGASALLLRQLAVICGAVPEEIEQRVEKLSIEQLEALGAAIPAIRTLDDVQSRLDELQ